MRINIIFDETFTYSMRPTFLKAIGVKCSVIEWAIVKFSSKALLVRNE